MCGFQRILERSKSWSIRSQMLVFFVVSLAIVLALIDGLAAFNLAYLKKNSVEVVREKAKSLESDDMLSTSYLMGHVLSVYLESGLMLLATVQSALLDCLSDRVTPLEPLASYEYGELPQSCMVNDPVNYGEAPVCVVHSSYFSLGTVNNTALEHISQLDYLLPTLGSLSYSGTQMHRLIMYFKEYEFVKVFPGTYLPETYDPESSAWYQSLLDNDNQPIVTENYTDSLGSQQAIVSLVFPLFDPSGADIGAMSLDVPLTNIYSSIINSTYHNESVVLLVAPSGYTLPNPYSNLWDRSFFVNVSRLAEEQRTVHNVEIGGKVMRAACSFLPSDSPWWYTVLLLLPTSSYEQFPDLEARDIETAGVWLITTTVSCSAVVLLAVSMCICVYSDRITSPLRGVTKFAKRLPNAATTHKLDLAALEELEEGENNVKELVRGFKKLVRRLVESPHTAPSKAMRFSLAQRQFPKNELHGPGRLSWRSALRQL